MRLSTCSGRVRQVLRQPRPSESLRTRRIRDRACRPLRARPRNRPVPSIAPAPANRDAPGRSNAPHARISTGGIRRLMTAPYASGELYANTTAVDGQCRDDGPIASNQLGPQHECNDGDDSQRADRVGLEGFPAVHSQQVRDASHRSRTSRPGRTAADPRTSCPAAQQNPSAGSGTRSGTADRPRRRADTDSSRPGEVRASW